MRLKKLLPRAIRKHLKSLLGRAAAARHDSRASLPQGPSGEFGPARLLASAPPIFLTGTARGAHLGIAGAFARRHGNTQAGFIVFPTWSIERSRAPQAIKEAFSRHIGRYSNQRFRFICNTQTETQRLAELDLPVSFLNKNFMVSDQIFQPVANTAVEFDAVYNARFIPGKRHELAAAIPRVAYIAYADNGREQEFRDLYAAMRARTPRHVLLNDMVDDLPRRMPARQVNAALGRAAVGLVLSEEEGSSYASMEYLLAGLPVVSTPSRGGRDVFFDPDYCIVCAPNPRSVGDAVAALRARNIPREEVRARTLAKIRPEREGFLRLIDDLAEELGGKRRDWAGTWPFGDESGAAWRPFKEHLDAFATRLRADLAAEHGLEPDALLGVQLEAGELRPIMAAIRERPRCALLVFGCGNDSYFWEKVNRDGTTVFLEDNPAWVDEARARLAHSVVHPVDYGTRLTDWQRLLDSPADLALKLPDAVGARRWDVIVVDGPAGYNDHQPGRMKSIAAAAKLVASGGCVFVHDCNRPAERAYASRYLGDDRLFIEAKGRAVLRGYAY